MFRIGKAAERQELEAMLSAIGKSQAVIEFGLDGKVITANENFLKTLGYELAEIKGRHHSIFVDPAERESAAYKEFWAGLGRGEYQAGEFKRIARDGREVWIQATYNPIFGRDGKPFKVVKFASDVTEQKRRDADLAGQLAAIGKSQAVIEFKLDGTIVSANGNFLKTLGYELAEIKGRHHSIFVDPAERDGAGYKEFWAGLGRGEYQAGEFKRIARDGREVWIQASYNPILDAGGRPYKVVKFASDITAEKRRNADQAGQLAAIGKSQAVIEFKLDGTILTANENFLSALGYGLAEIQGKHHSIFVEPGERDSAEYRSFWDNLRRGEFQ
ncbi:PAS domain S-box-containing protein, partial [Tistlia consotensis]